MIIRDLLTDSEGREKAENCLPNYMGFPFKPYIRNGGIRVQYAWRKVRGLTKVA